MAEFPANQTASFASSANSANATLCQAGNTRLRQITGYNASASPVWLKLYDVATTPASTDTPRKRYYLPASTAFTLDMDAYFANGLGYRLVTGSADNDATSIAAGAVLGFNVDFR